MTTQFAQPDNTHWGGDNHVPRDRYGRPLITPPDGGKPVAYTRATTYIQALSDTSNLTQWKLRLAGQGLASRPDLIDKIRRADPDDKKTLNEVMTAALDQAGQYDKANIGTMIHQATEAHDLGQPIPEVGKYQPDVEAYIHTMRPYTIIDVETFRIHDDLQVAGTADRVVEYKGNRFIADVKTGSLYSPLTFAMQLALYARSVPYSYETGERTPDEQPISTTHGLLIHLPAGEGTCTLYWLNLAAGWEALKTVGEVRRWRQLESRKATRGEVITPVA